MTLCDRPEAAQTERERRRDLVSTASERRIAIARDATGIAGEVRSYLGKLQFLTKSPGRMSSLRSAIFHAVVRSALATPAQTFPADVAAKPRDHFGVRWPTRRLDEVAEHIVDCPHSTPKWTEAGKICVRTNQFRPGYLDLTGVRYVIEATYRERVQRLTPKADDILYSREGGILGVACRVPPETELCLGQRMMLIRPSREVDPRFLEMILNSPPIYALAKAATTGGAAPRVNVATVKAYPIPVPPLPQQREIVAKVNELMALSQKLEAFLTEGQARRSRLLHAVIRQALDAA